MANTIVELHRWTRREYERMVGAGVFHPQARLELIDGGIIDMTPQGSLHATAVGLTERTLNCVFGAGYYIRIQMPLALDDVSEPEPDLAVVMGSPRDYRDAHPHTAALVIEVADTTLMFDRDQKKKLYARNAISEYWIVNLVEGRLEVYRDPQRGNFTSTMILHPGQSISALPFPERRIRIADLLP